VKSERQCALHDFTERGLTLARYLKMLLDKAFETFPGEVYNKYFRDVRERTGKTLLFYEVSLMEPRPWAHVRDQIYPNFARYLKAKRHDPGRGSGVIVAIFVGERCHLLKGEDFLAVYRAMERLDGVAFTARVTQWLSQSESRVHLYPLTTSSPRT
jgi:hypothetical protein